MPDVEAIASVRDFVERGGNVLLVIACVTAVMWTLILERFWYFRALHRRERARVETLWNARTDHRSWAAHQVRRMLVSEVRMKLERGLPLIRTLVALCPMFGLLGTVTGMIEVFDVMAVAGSGNARGMAAGVSKATLPTMAGMVAALSGMLFSVQLERFARDESSRVEDSLELVTE
jgi:biopolymer transport protein ExbB